MLKPKKFEVNIVYNCPSCGDEFWYESEELKGRPTLYCCNKIHNIKPIKNMTLKCKFSNKPTDKAISILKNYGFTTNEIKSSNITGTDTKDFIRKFLASQEL